MLVSHRDDPVLVDAVISSLKGREAAALERLLTQTAMPAAKGGAASAAMPRVRGTAPRRRLATRQGRERRMPTRWRCWRAR